MDRAFGHFQPSESLVIGDLLQLVCLLCPTFPEQRILEIPRLLKIGNPNSRISFEELSTAFSIHFAFYDSLMHLKDLFMVPVDDDRRIEWRPQTLEAVRLHAATSTVETQIPDSFIKAAFVGVEELAFDNFVLRLLKNRDLCRHACVSPDSSVGNCFEWHPRDHYEV